MTRYLSFPMQCPVRYFLVLTGWGGGGRVGGAEGDRNRQTSLEDLGGCNMGVIYEWGAGSAGGLSQWLVGDTAFYGYFLVLTGLVYSILDMFAYPRLS